MASDQPLAEAVEAIDKNRLMVDNEGNSYVNNRAARRRKTRRARTITQFGYVDVPENKYTKSTNKIKKLRSKNARTEQQRKRDAARARKARKESYSQES